MAVSPSLIAEAVGWRREFHAAPELGYQEQETSRRVAELLASFGLQVHTAGWPAPASWRRWKTVPGRSSACAPIWTPCRSPSWGASAIARAVPG